jgi:hypothetical protein
VYPNGSYYVVDIHLENDVDAVAYLVRLSGAAFMNIKYQETKLAPPPSSTPTTETSGAKTTETSGATTTETSGATTTETSGATTTETSTVPFYTSSSCCSNLEQKQDACVSYLKKYY